MASFVGSAPLRRTEWTVEDAARFAALKEFKLLQLRSADKKAFATARVHLASARLRFRGFRVHSPM